MVEITEHEVVDIDRVNASGKLPVMLAIVGHSFGGLLTQGEFVPPCLSRSMRPRFAASCRRPSRRSDRTLVLGNPANRDRSVRRTYEQFHCAFANAVSERSQIALRDLLRPELGSGDRREEVR